jgi:hypothetical protein
MNRIPPYVVLALLGLSLVFSALVMVATFSGGIQADDTVVMEVTSTPTETPTPTMTPTATPTVYIPPTLPPPTVEVIAPTVEVIQPTVDVIPPTVEVLSPTVEVAAPTIEAIAPTVAVVVPTVDPALPQTGLPAPAPGISQPTIEPVVEVAPTSEIVPTIEATAIPDVLPTADPVILPTVAVTEVIAPTLEVIAPTAEIPPTVDIAPTLEVIAPTAEILPTIEAAPTDASIITLAPPTETPIPATETPTAIPPTVAVNGSISGSVTRMGTTDATGITVLLSKPDGTVISANLSATGEFSFPDLVPGAYQIVASASGYVPRQAQVIVEMGIPVSLPATQLVAGDTNDDGRIDIADAALVASNFDANGVVTPTVDLNRDGRIDILDLAQIGASFGLVGPTGW